MNEPLKILRPRKATSYASRNATVSVLRFGSLKSSDDLGAVEIDPGAAMTALVIPRDSSQPCRAPVRSTATSPGPSNLRRKRAHRHRPEASYSRLRGRSQRRPDHRGLQRSKPQHADVRIPATHKKVAFRGLKIFNGSFMADSPARDAIDLICLTNDSWIYSWKLMNLDIEDFPVMACSSTAACSKATATPSPVPTTAATA